MNIKRKCLCIFICVIILSLSFCINASATFVGAYEIPALISDKCANVPMFWNGEYIGYALERHDVFYVPAADFIEQLLGKPCTLYYSLPNSAICLRIDGHKIYCYQDLDYITVNDRYIPLEQTPRKIDGQVWFPISTLAQLIGAEVKINDSSSSISISYQSRGVIPTASDVYNPNDLYWLSRVIFAESGTQPFEGMIGVGNVVLNRVESIRFPDSVYDVIFQKNQFSVVDCGMIYREPDERSIIAAKLCLEGADSAGESLYFINPALCNGSWFRNNLTFTERIGEHDFFM